MKTNKGKEKRVLNINLWLVAVAIIASVIGVFFLSKAKINNLKLNLSPENQRAINYGQYQDGDEAVDGTDNVKLNAFFLRDLNGDGYAEKLKGTCKEIGKEDTLYMEIIVQTEGKLKNGKIEINGHNFYMQTVLPKDNELKSSYIGSDIKLIEFEDLNNGTQKMLADIVKSGDYSYDSAKYSSIGSNVNNYSRDDNKTRRKCKL